ncbi:hypothetical protein BDP27DRAFT_704772 [Rhodocollybia butyracea]|uniref:Uncharacterized protein n=1 Tax=Rhodocollybia butyracea TaxID=206335 RepID=A0A9P5Q9Q7_9AGAR|nr:hypothetical protein BDP27DRAFT_704772 [Rhodocollybia butyracea]
MVLLDTSDHLQVSSDSCPSENLASSSDITSALLLHNDPVEPAIIDCVQTTQDLDESEPSLPKDDQLSLPEQSSSTSDAVSVPPSCDEPKVPVSPSSTSITTKPILGKTKSKPKSSLASSITSSKPRVTVNVVTRMRPIPNGQRNGAGTSAKVKESLGREKDRETLKARTSEVVNSHASKRFRESDGDAKETKVSEIPPKKKVRVTDEATEKVRSKPSLSPLSDFSLSLKSSSSSLSDLTSSSSEFTSETSLRAVRRKRKASSPSPPNKPPLIPQKKRKVVFVELPILPKRKLEIAPPDDIPPPDESNDPSWVDEGWVDALAAAYGSPASRKSNAPHPQTTPIRKRSRKQPVAKPLFELDSSSDDLEDEDHFTQSSQRCSIFGLGRR